MTDAWHDLREEEHYERRRARGYYRRDPATPDIYRHDPTPEDRRVEPPLNQEQP